MERALASAVSSVEVFAIKLSCSLDPCHWQMRHLAPGDELSCETYKKPMGCEAGEGASLLRGPQAAMYWLSTLLLL